MIKNNFFKSGVTAFLLCSFVPAAFASAVQTPDEGWMIKSIATKKGSEPGYCAMKSHFRNGPTMIIARESTGANALALDFHKNKFQAGVHYNVKAQTGSVTRDVEALAASKQVLLLQMGVDTEFFGELQHKHALNLTAGKNNYKFDLDASASDALAALGHCVAGLQVGMTFADAAFPLGASHAQSTKKSVEKAESIDAAGIEPAAGNTAAESIDAGIDNTAVASPPTEAKTANGAAGKEAVNDISGSEKTVSPPKSVAKTTVANNHSAAENIPEEKVADSNITAGKNANDKTADKTANDPLADNVQDIAEGRTADAGYVAEPSRRKKKHHKQARNNKNNIFPSQVAQPVIQVVNAPPSEEQVDAVRDDIKAEIASEVLALTAGEGAQKTTGGPDVPSMPVAPVESSALTSAKTPEGKTATAKNAVADAQNELTATEASDTKRLDTQAELAQTRAELATLKRDHEQTVMALQAKLAEKSGQTNIPGISLSQAKEKAALQSEMAMESTETVSVADSAPLRQSRSGNLDVKDLLLSSHVLSAQQIKIGDNGSLEWAADGLFGSAQQSPLSPGKSLTETADDYLRKTASVCAGDFGQKVGKVESTGNLNVLQADITCIDGQHNAAAAILFVSDNGTVSVITEEGTIEQLHNAMMNRDTIISTALGNTSPAPARTRGGSDTPAAGEQQSLLQQNDARIAPASGTVAYE